MTRTYVPRREGERTRWQRLTCDRCARTVSFPFATAPELWPLHRCPALGRPAPFTHGQPTTFTRDPWHGHR